MFDENWLTLRQLIQSFIMKQLIHQKSFITVLLVVTFVVFGCQQQQKEAEKKVEKTIKIKAEKPEYFMFRPEVEKAYGYTHAIKIGNDIKISGAVSMDDEGNPTAINDLEQQMKNCYSDLEKILTHFGCTFDDVVVENIYTTNMPLMLEKSAYRGQIYKDKFPTGTWVGVETLALPEFMIEIELEVYKPE